MIPNSNGNGSSHSPVGMGQETFADLLGTESFMGELKTGLQPIVGDIVNEIRPHLQELAKEATDMAAPKIREIIKEDIMPKASIYIIVGLAAAGAVGALAAVTVLKR